jgi:hypothetical protein
VLLATLLVFASCSSDFERQLAEAEQLRQEAAAAGAEWLQTERLLEQAREEAAQGDTQSALALVAEARFQAEAALRQAEHEAEAWRDRVVR